MTEFKYINSFIFTRSKAEFIQAYAPPSYRAFCLYIIHFIKGFANPFPYSESACFTIVRLEVGNWDLDRHFLL